MNDENPTNTTAPEQDAVSQDNPPEPNGYSPPKPSLRSRLSWWVHHLKGTAVWRWRALCERAKWIGYEPSPLETFARRELELAGWYDDTDGDSFGRMMAADTMAVIRAFCEAGHSGGSAGPAVVLFRELALYRVLTPLTGEGSEWGEPYTDPDGCMVYQNKRCSHVFKYVTPTETYAEDIQGRVFREPSGACFTSYDSRVRVTFPYMPKVEYVDVAQQDDPACPCPKVIGLCGFKGAGKSTAADLLVKHYGYVRVRFAGPLKDMVRALGLTDAQIDGDEKEAPLEMFGGMSPRKIMQTLGTEWGRDMVVKDLWERLLRKRVDDLLARGFRVVVDDVRFPNEADMILSYDGAVMWRLDDGDVPVAAQCHPSERHVLDLPVSLVLDNRTKDEALRQQIDLFFGRGCQ